MIRRNRAIFYILLSGLVIGLIIGIISAITFKDESFYANIKNVQAYLNSFNLESIDKKDNFIESTLKYAKTVIIIWTMAFIPIGGFITFGTIFIKSIAYGFTAGFLVRGYGASGVLCIILLFLPQALIMLSVYFYTAYKSIYYILFNLQPSKNRRTILDYFTILFIGLVCSTIVAFLDAYIVPEYISKILSVI